METIGLKHPGDDSEIWQIQYLVLVASIALGWVFGG